MRKDSKARSEVMQLAESYGAKIVDVTLDFVTLEYTEEKEKIQVKL